MAQDNIITQPWNDNRLKLNDIYIGCVTKGNADLIMKLQSAVISLRNENKALRAEQELSGQF